MMDHERVASVASVKSVKSVKKVSCGVSTAAALLLLGAVAALSATATAQTYPGKPVRIIVPFAAGGNLDIVTRSLAQKLTEQMGQQMVVENRAGAAGALGAEAVAKAAPDGYTLLATSNTFVATAAVVRKVPYDPVKDYSCVSVFAWLPQILVVNPSLPVYSVKDLIDLAKRKPGEITYGSAGNGGVGHITAEMFSHQAGIKLIHVPYKGNAPALTDVVGGQIAFMFDTISTSIQYVKTGRLKGLGVTSAKPSPIFPNLPSISASGLPGYEALVFNIMLAPTATPRPVVDRLHAEIVKAVGQSDIRARFIDQGVDLAANASPEECASFVKGEVDKYAQIVRDANIRAE